MADTRIDQLAPCGMITLRGAPDAEWVPDLMSIIGFEMPETRRFTATEAGCAIWFSPDELFILCDRAIIGQAVAQMQAACREAQVHALVADVSDARVRFAISGPGARVTLAKLCPVDLAPGQFGPGDVRRTRLSQVACGFWMTGQDAFELICFRSVADYVRTALDTAATPAGALSLG